MIAVLGVLAAGGAYVPLDPELPPARIALIREDSGAAVLLTQEPLRRRLAAFGGEAICLDREPGLAAALVGESSTPNRSDGLGGDSLAYVVYTSGSTGRPKGVLGAHAGAVSYLRFLLSAYGLAAGDRALQLASLSFDASVRDLLGPLAAGATVVLVEPERAKDAAALVAAIERQRITCLPSVVPSLLRSLLDAAEERGGGSHGALRLILASGERLHYADAARVRRAFGPAVEIVNQYGPTECTMTSSFHRLAATGRGAAEAPVGRPIRERRFHVLDGGAPVPRGAVGDLYVGGRGLSRGYLGRPDLTAACFIPDPFGTVPGGRLYATGDRVRQLADGSLEFLGRADQQIKLRGFRIEPAEVERELCRHPQVKQAAVLLREDQPGEARLVAYVAAEGDGAPARELREMLARRLPDYMVPALFVPLSALPLTPNGKLDRRALPPPERASPSAVDGEPVAPRTPVEEILAGIWSDLLRRERLGVDDNFFELGGHSLLATRVASRVRGTLGVDLPLAELFARPTVARLAQAVAERLQAGAPSLLPPLGRADRSRPLPLSFAQQRLWFLEQLAPGMTAYHMRAAVLLAGPLDVAALEAALGEVVRRHEALRTTFASTAGEPVQVVGPSRPVPLPVVDLTGLPPSGRAAARQRLVRDEAKRCFDLSRGPLLRASLLRLAAQEHAALLTVHHIVSDAWSMGLLVHELGTLYDGVRQGRPSPLPELAVQYADFALWQRQWLTGEVLAGEVAYWRERLGERPPVLELPTDRPRPAAQTFAGAAEPVRLCATALTGLRSLARQRG
ncbi:MAG TPA: amino acid adenylation domain-containing protein, partial [Solirubrobacterales bacterium]|nr:amino acid adenylation domain-containing protein [Solirubrobacterales bacterium]